MKIGWVSDALPYLPSTDGFRLYGANLLRFLGNRHRINLIAIASKDDAKGERWAAQYCESVTLIPSSPRKLPIRVANFFSSYALGANLHGRISMQRLVDYGFRTLNWDLLHVEGSYSAGLMESTAPGPRVLSLHDSFLVRCEQLAKCATSPRDILYYQLLKRHERRYRRLVYPRFDRCLVVAQSEKRDLTSFLQADRICVLPNGVDAYQFRPSGKGSEYKIAFHGHLGYPPNVDAAIHLARDLFPRIRQKEPRATLLIVGAAPCNAVARLRHVPGVTVEANVPDIARSLSSAQVYACAIRHGTGVKNKILEAMAMGLPIVSYASATAGIDCHPGRDLLTVSSATEFTQGVLLLMRDRERRMTMGRAARLLVEQRHSWESRAAALEALYENLIREESLPTEGRGKEYVCSTI